MSSHYDLVVRRIHLYPAQIRRSQRGHSDRVRVDGIGLATVAGGNTRTRADSFWHVDHDFAVVGQAVSEMASDTVTSFDRPEPIFERCR